MLLFALQNLILPNLIFQNLLIYITEDSTYMNHRTLKEWAGIDLEASSLLACFHGAIRCYTHFWRKKKVVIELTQLWTLQVTIMTSLARHAHCCKSGLNIMGVTNHSLIRCKFFSRRWHSYLALLLSQKPVIRHIISRPHPFFSRLEVVSEDGKIVGVRTGGWVQEHSVLQT